MEVQAISGLTTFEIISIFSKLIPNENHKKALMLWGLTGTGKSQIQRQILKGLANGKTWTPAPGIAPSGALEVIGEWGLVDLRTSLLEPTDLRGLPDLKGKTVRWLAPEELPLIGQEDRFPAKGVLLLDEITHAQPAMQSACFSLVLDRRCGPHQLMPGWKIVAASNFSSENSHTHMMSDPLRNRFEHYHLRCSLDAFKQWALATGINPKVVAFLNWNPDFLHKPTEVQEESFPTPRTWADASQAMEIFTNGDLPHVLVAHLGSGSAEIFNGFLRIFGDADLSIDLLSVLKGKEKAPKLTTKKPDIAWAFTARLAGYVKENPKLLSPALAFLCSNSWKDAVEIGKTGISDLKHIVGNEVFTSAVRVHHAEIQKLYGALT